MFVGLTALTKGMYAYCLSRFCFELCVDMLMFCGERVFWGMNSSISTISWRSELFLFLSVVSRSFKSDDKASSIFSIESSYSELSSTLCTVIAPSGGVFEKGGVFDNLEYSDYLSMVFCLRRSLRSIVGGVMSVLLFCGDFLLELGLLLFDLSYLMLPNFLFSGIEARSEDRISGEWGC